MTTRYVVSEDIDILLHTWAGKRGFILPSKEFFQNLRKEMKRKLQEVFGDKVVVEMIPARRVREGLGDSIDSAKHQIVSLEKTYYLFDYKLEACRAVDPITLESIGLVPRHGKKSLCEQVDALKDILAQNDIKEIILLDDVVFSGGIVEIIEYFEAQNIKVKGVICGICIGEGCEKILKKGIDVSYAIFYQEVVDEICERDFYPGSPFSGRTIFGQERDTGVPYIFPFGKPHEWASIPKEKCKEFSAFCLSQAITLWEGVEECSSRVVRCSDLERFPIGTPNDDSRFVDYLLSLV